MIRTLHRAPLWSDQAEPECTCGWSYELHRGRNTMSNMRKSAHDGCVRCKLLLDGIEKYKFLPYHHDRTTRVTLSEYEPDPGLWVTVSNDFDKPLEVGVHYQDHSGMEAESRSFHMELSFYTDPGSFDTTSNTAPTSFTYPTQTSHLTSPTFRQQAISRLTLHPKLALAQSRDG